MQFQIQVSGKYFRIAGANACEATDGASGIASFDAETASIGAPLASHWIGKTKKLKLW